MNALNSEYVIALEYFILHNMKFFFFKKIDWNCLTIKLLVYTQTDVYIWHLNDLLIGI